MVLRTIISDIYGAVADMCDELICRISGCSESAGEFVAQNNSENTSIPTKLPTTNETLRTNDNVQGILLHDHENKFASLPDHHQLIELCSDVALQRRWRRDCFTTLDDAELDKMGGSCREQTLLSDNAASRVKGWIR